MTLRDGIYRVERVDWRVSPFDWAFPREAAVHIDAHWEARRQAAPGIYDGRVLLMRDLELGESSLRCLCFETSYKSFLGWRDGGVAKGAIYNCFGMAALRSVDGAFMLGAMNAGTASAGKLYFPAGTPEPSDVVDGRVDLEGNVLRELGEETGIGRDEVVADTGCFSQVCCVLRKRYLTRATRAR